MRIAVTAILLVASTLRDVAAQEPATAPTPIASRAVATLRVPGFADFLAVDGDAVWATNEGRVELLRRDSPLPVASVAIAEPCGAMVVAYGSLWVANCRDSSIVRVDLITRTVSATIQSGLADPTGELSLAAGAGSVWILSDRRGVLSRIDAATNRVVARITVAPNSFAAVFDFGSVWITNTGAERTRTGAVQRIDPATNKVTATIPVGPTPRFLAAGEGGVWTLNQGDGTVTRIDPRTDRRVATIEAGIPGTGGDIAAGGGRVWVRGKSVLLAAVDPATNRVVESFGPPAGSGAVRVAGNGVWVTAHDIRTVWVLPVTQSSATTSCFILREVGGRDFRRSPSEACRTLVTPASTFKVPHALAALDAGVVSGPDEVIPYDGKGNWPESSRRDHTLASAMRFSVVWYFQRIAERLGKDGERRYLQRFRFGNMDASSGLTTFWLGGSLQVTPEEELEFWERLYQDRLPVSKPAAEAVRAMLVQPAGTVVNALGEHPFAAPWPSGAVVSAKTGSATDRSGRAVRWLVGHVARGARSYVFVSCIIGDKDLDANAAIDLAAKSLRESGVL